jgi:hypothetical protein
VKIAARFYSPGIRQTNVEKSTRQTTGKIKIVKMRRATKISKTKTGASNREKRNYAVCDVVGDFPITNSLTFLISFWNS